MLCARDARSACKNPFFHLKMFFKLNNTFFESDRQLCASLQHINYACNSVQLQRFRRLYEYSVYLNKLTGVELLIGSAGRWEGFSVYSLQSMSKNCICVLLGRLRSWPFVFEFDHMLMKTWAIYVA